MSKIINVIRVSPLVFKSLLFFLVLSVLFISEVNALPEWWGNDIGKEQVVLPGYDPIHVVRNKIILGAGKEYSLGQGIVFGSMDSRNNSFVLGDLLLVTINGKSYKVKADSYNFTAVTQHHTNIEIFAKVENLLKVKLLVRVEYDGVVMIDLIITPIKPVEVSELTYKVDIKSNEWTKMLAFKPDTAHVRQKKVVFDPSYKGEFLNAVSIVDGDRSFWWFADNADGWIGPLDEVTEVVEKNDIITLTQKLINKDVLLKNEKRFQFNLMVTPVKNSVGNIRQNRHARSPSKDRAKHQGINIWWITAFAHQILPYTDYTNGIKKKISKGDVRAYPGLEKNKNILNRYKKLAIDRLPYFSARMISQYDPFYKKYLSEWEVHPERGWHNRKYDMPFTGLRDESYLTHRADGYTDYLLYRFSELADELGFEGLYFDQGGVVGSKNPLNGRWLDSGNNVRPSTDILAMRSFHKRLATMLYLKGKKALIFSHNSNTAILPAYSFVTAMVQGEEYIHWLKNYDYINSVDLDEVRTRIGSSAFGVATMWMEVLYAKEHRLDLSKRPYKMNKAEWLSSDYYITAYKNFMALALLHDMPTVAFAPVVLKNEIFDIFDWVNPESSKFVGYWNFPKNKFKDNVFYSYYASLNKEKLLLVVSNLGNGQRKIDITKIISNINILEDGICNIWKVKDDFQLSKDKKVNEKSFVLIQLECET